MLCNVLNALFRGVAAEWYHENGMVPPWIWYHHEEPSENGFEKSVLIDGLPRLDDSQAPHRQSGQGITRPVYSVQWGRLP